MLNGPRSLLGVIVVAAGVAVAAPPEWAGRVGDLDNARRIDTSAGDATVEAASMNGWNVTIAVDRNGDGSNQLTWPDSGLSRLHGHDVYYRIDAPTPGSNDGRIETGARSPFRDIDGATRCEASRYWVLAYDRGRKNYVGPIQGSEGELCGGGGTVGDTSGDSGGGTDGGTGNEPPAQGAVNVIDTGSAFPSCGGQIELYRETSGAPTGYILHLDDDFKQWPLDANKWHSDYDWGSDIIINDELQYYVDTLGVDAGLPWTPFLAGENVSGDQEYAVIRPAIAADTGVDLASVGGQRYLSGILRSRQTLRAPTGSGGWYIEARLAPASGTGMWSAFWTYTSQYTRDAEIDVLEYLGQNVGGVRNLTYDTFDTAYNAVHRKSRRGKGRLQSDLEWNNGDLSDTPEWCGEERDLSGEFHVYGVEWTADAITWYVDDIQVWQVTDPELISDESMFIQLNVALGGPWPGTPTTETDQRIRSGEVQMAIDWVRVYRR